MRFLGVGGCRRIGFLSFVCVLVLASCGSDRTEEGAGEDRQIVKIGLIAPLSGELSAIGLGIKNGAKLAIIEVNKSGRIPGWKIELVSEDDSAKPDVGATAASKLVSDKKVVGVVGTFNSSVAQQVQPILAKAGIAMVSPANTSPTLTQGGDPKKKERPYPNYFRVSTTDAVQGPFGADFAYKEHEARRVAIIHDKKSYGEGLALAFQDHFKKLGGKIVALETINPGDKDFSAVLSKIQVRKPDLIYYGGEYPEASLLSHQIDQIGLNIPLMGGDGVFDRSFVKVAGKASEGDYVTSIGAPAGSLPRGRSFLESYKDAGFAEESGAYGAYAYDATNVLIDVLAGLLDGQTEFSESLRANIVVGLNEVEHDGVTGEVSFDEYGDTHMKLLTVYVVKDGEFEPVRTVTFQ